jgi:hypothetical protein
MALEAADGFFARLAFGKVALDVLLGFGVSRARVMAIVCSARLS